MPSQFALSSVDYVVIGMIIFGAIWGTIRKLSREVFTLTASVFSFIVALLTYRITGEKIIRISRLDNRSAEAIAFVGVIIAIVCILAVMKLLLRKVFTLTVESKLERPGGCIAGFISFSLIACMIFYVLILFPHEYLNRKLGDESVIGRRVKNLFPALRKLEIPEATDKKKSVLHSESIQKKNDTKKKKSTDVTTTNSWI